MKLKISDPARQLAHEALGEWLFVDPVKYEAFGRLFYRLRIELYTDEQLQRLADRLKTTISEIRSDPSNVAILADNCSLLIDDPIEFANMMDAPGDDYDMRRDPEYDDEYDDDEYDVRRDPEAEGDLP